MTAQIADGLHNTHPRIRFEDLRLYGVIRGNPYSNHGWGTAYEFGARPDPERAVLSSCWRGFQSWFRLEADGTIILERFEYPFTSRPPKLVDEPLTGDFFLVFKRSFFGRRIYALFRDGKIVEDSSQWLFEPLGGWSFEQGTHRDLPAVVVEPDPATGCVKCPTCRITFSVCDENTWNGSRHCCGQSLKLALAGKVLDNDVASHRVLFDGIAMAFVYTPWTDAVCPRCSESFSLHNVSDQDTVRHECGQQMKLSLREPPPPMPFDLAKVEALSRPLLARLDSTKDGKLTSGTCPNCETEGNLRVCDGRVVLCFKCYMGVSGRPWLHQT